MNGFFSPFSKNNLDTIRNTETLTISRIERDMFRSTGRDIEIYEDMMRLSIKDYAQSLERIREIRRAHRNRALTRMEMIEYRKFTGKLSWLTTGNRPELS